MKRWRKKIEEKKNVKKRRYFDLESLTESKSVDWSSCIICEVHTNEKLECPSDLKRKGYDPFKTYQNIANNINRFRELNTIPIDSLILSKEKCTTDLFLNMKIPQAVSKQI